MAGFFANLEPCLIGLKACGNSYHWARKLGEFGHSVKLMSPQLVKPYVKTNKHDRADAEAICEAVTIPTILLYTDQDCWATSHAVSASCPAEVCQGQNHTGKSDTRSTL